MQKLIKLLNEYEIWKTKDKISQNPNRSRREWYRWQLGSIIWTLMNERESRLSIISKSYWFIKWLVDNDKIEFSKYWKVSNEEDRRTEYHNLLMLLSIQDKPIKFLVSILK